MPQKTKTKKSSKSSVSRFFSKLNPNSPKKKLLLFVIVFGLIAGGFYTYQTFARPNTIIVDAKYMSGGDPKYVNVNGKRQLFERGIYHNPEIIRTMDLPRRGRYNWRVCLNVRNTAWAGKAKFYITFRKSVSPSWESSKQIEVPAGFGGWKEVAFTGHEGKLLFKISRSNSTKSSVQFLGIRQVAFVKNGYPCP